MIISSSNSWGFNFPINSDLQNFKTFGLISSHLSFYLKPFQEEIPQELFK